MTYNSPKKFIPFISISANKCVLYTKNVAPDMNDYTQYWLNRGATIDSEGKMNFDFVDKRIVKDNRQHGLLSEKANKKVNDIIDWMVLLSKEKTSLNHSLKSFYKWKLNFVTLTLPSKQVHSDKIIKSELLNDFLTQAKRTYNIVYYFWRAEAQSNGNIHFHIVTDKFIPWEWCRNKWNHICNKLNYVDKFEEKYKHTNPNSTDIHSLKNIRNISKYLSKYCSKSSKGITVLTSKAKNYKVPLFISFKWLVPDRKAKFYRQVHGKLWGCSEVLSRLKKCSCQISDKMNNEIIMFQSKNPTATKFFDYVSIISINAVELVANGLYSIRDFLYKHVKSILSPQLSINDG